MTDKPRLRQTTDGGWMSATGDSLQNLVSGMGTMSDKRSHNTFRFNFDQYSFYELEAAYLENWIARQIVNVPVDDGLREWRSWQTEHSSDIEKAEKKLGVRKAYKQARYWARLYGGAGILMLTGQPLDRPLDVKKVKKGGLSRLVVLDRWDIQPQWINYTNPIAEDYLLPEFYRIRGGTQNIHSSHMIRVDGDEMPRRIRSLNEGWGDSTLRKCKEDLQDIVATKGGIATLVMEANVDVVTRNGLSDELATDQEGAILKRYALAAQMKSFVNQMLLDGEETYERKSLTFSGLSQILEQFMVYVSGAADIPMARLFGQTAGGLAATGEGDLNNYYDNVAAMQEGEFTPDLDKLDQVLVRSALGNYPEDIDWEWNPLYQESGTELAQQDLATTQAESVRIQDGILKRSHVMRRLKQKGEYAITDEEIEQAVKEEEAEESGMFDVPPEPGEEGELPEVDLPQLPGSQ